MIELNESDLAEFCRGCGELLNMSDREAGICPECDQVVPSEEEMETYAGRLDYGFRLLETSEDLE